VNDPERVSLGRVWGQQKMLVLLILGFASGLPLYLTSQVLQAWMATEKIDLGTITIFGLVALPYSLKFLWAPVMDRYTPSFLGRRRGWLLITQLALLLAIAAMALQDPRRGVQMLAINAVLIAFLSASQDIVTDAYRTDVLAQREMGAGAAIFVLGYRIALLATGALAFVLADRMSWPMVYLALSLLMMLGVGATLLAPEPVLRDRPPQTFGEAVVLPFREFFQRAGVSRALLVLGFIVLYKLPDALAAIVATPFLVELGFSLAAIGTIKGGIGIGATIVGSLVGGSIVAKMGINRSLWLFGALQAISNLAYYGLALVGNQYSALVATIIIENVCTGLVAAGFVAFLMSLCSMRFSATQYALLSSLAALSRDIVVAPAGEVVKATGWSTFFLLSVVAAIPGLLLLPVFAPWNGDAPLVAAPHTGETATGVVD
jgi:PAT family beta-lactamase induction signal transducer AmpG